LFLLSFLRTGETKLVSFFGEAYTLQAGIDSVTIHELNMIGETAASRQRLSDFFTIARFGPDSIGVFAFLGILSFGLYYSGFWYLSSAIIVLFGIIFFIECIEKISLSRAQTRRVIGARCLVVQKATGDHRGIVRLFDPEGSLEYELWSIECSNQAVETGQVAIVTGMNSIILEIESLA
jgi:hypothetical protein